MPTTDDLTVNEEAVWKYVTQVVKNSAGATNEFQLSVEDLCNCVNVKRFVAPHAATIEVLDILESLRQKGMSIRINKDEIMRFGYIAEATFYAHEPKHLTVTLNGYLRQLITHATKQELAPPNVSVPANDYAQNQI